MSRGYNKVILIGNAACDPDVRATTTLLRVARFTVACGREWRDKTTGEKKTDCDFIQCQAWGNLADVIERYVRKGKGVMVEGRLRVTKYTDKSGAEKWATDVVVDNLLLLGSSKADSASAPVIPQQQTASASLSKEADDDFPLDMTDIDVDVPF